MKIRDLWHRARNRWARPHVTVPIFPTGATSYRALVIEGAGSGSEKVIADLFLTAENPEVLQQKLQRQAVAILALPRNEVIVKTIQIPSVDSRQIARIIRNELNVHLPWPPEESQVAFHIQPSEEEGYSEVVMIMARRELIDRRLSHLQKHGLEPSMVVALFLMFGPLVTLNKQYESSAVLYAEKESIEYVRFRCGRHAFSRGTGTEEEPGEMLRRSLELDRRRNGSKYMPGCLIAGGSRFREVEPLQDLELIDLNAALSTDVERIKPGGEACLVVARFASAMTETLNLLPEAPAKKLHLRWIIKNLKWASLLSAWLIAAFFFGGYSLFAIEQSRAQEAELSIQQLRETVGNLKEEKEALDLLAGERGRIGLPLQVLLEIYQVTPTAIALHSLVYDSRGQLSFSGEAPSFQSLYDYMAKLSGSALFDNVEIKHGVKPQSSGSELVDFKVTCNVRGRR